MSIARIYVAGPMTKGDLMRNVRMAIDAAHIVRQRGWFPYVPQLASVWHLIHPRPYEDWMTQDFTWIQVCDAIVRLPGESAGADREVAFAESLGKRVYFGLDAVPELSGWREGAGE